MKPEEIKEILIALQERNNDLEDRFNALADAGDNISAKGTKKQLKIIRKLINKIRTSEDIVFDGENKKNEKDEKKSAELNICKQRDILLDLSYSLLKELKNEELEKDSNRWQEFIYQAESKIKELEEIKAAENR